MEQETSLLITQILALWGAVLSTLVVAWQFRDSLRQDGRLRLTIWVGRASSSPWQKGLIVNRESRVRIGVSPDHPTTNRADHGAPGPRSAAHAPSSRSGGRSAPPPAPPRGPGGSAACPRPSGAA